MDAATWNSTTDVMAMLSWVTSDSRMTMLGATLEYGTRVEHGRLASDRKLRLFACACGRLIWHLLDEDNRRCISWQEDNADEQCPDQVAPNWGAALYAGRWSSMLLASKFGGEWTGQADLAREIFGNPFRPIAFDPAWRSATVLSLAEAAYRERAGRVCGSCQGGGNRPNGYALANPKCVHCNGSGVIATGQIDNTRLAILADALEDAGMPSLVTCGECKGEKWVWKGSHLDVATVVDCPACHGKGHVLNPLLQHLRSEAVHVRGCWATDLILGKT